MVIGKGDLNDVCVDASGILPEMAGIGNPGYDQNCLDVLLKPAHLFHWNVGVNR